MKRIVTILSIIATLLFVVSCGGQKAAEGEQKKEATTAGAKKSVAVVYSTGGKGDKSFNDAVFRGLEKAKAELGVDFKEYEPKDPGAESANQLKEFAQTGEFELIVGVGFTMKDSIIDAAKSYPEQKFVIIDEVVTDLPNVMSITFKEEEGSFLVGALAAMMSKTGTIGFVGGLELPTIKKFQAGYEQGAKYVNPNIKVLSVYIGGNNGFNDPASAKTKTETLIQQKADVVYHAAGGSGAGVFEAAKEKNIYAIGVDSNQDYILPGIILTSMMKYVDVATFNAVKEAVEGKFESTHKILGIKEGAIGTTEFEFTKDKIGEANIKKLEELKKEIIEGKIKVSTTVQ